MRRPWRISADADPNYRQTMIQPPSSDGTYDVPSKRRCRETTMRASYWARHRKGKFHSWGCTTVPCEPATFVINHRKEWTHMIANTDDFAVSASSQSYLNIIRVPFEKEWNISPMRFTQLMVPLVCQLCTGLGYRVPPYLDEFLVCPARAGRVATRSDCGRTAREISKLLGTLGLTRRLTKEEWSCSTRVEHLGCIIDTKLT
jgi:hypothetical protein